MSYLLRVRLRLKGMPEREPPVSMHLVKIPAVGDRIEVPYRGAGLWAAVSYVWSPAKEQPDAIHDVDAEQE